jgi:hypothetical protein
MRVGFRGLGLGAPNEFYLALSRAKLRRVTFHTPRQSCASAMIASGAPITEVQHRLGHAYPAITLLVYSHFLKHAESDVADRLADELLNLHSAPRNQLEIKKRGSVGPARLLHSSGSSIHSRNSNFVSRPIPQSVSSMISFFASFRSAVSKPSVNQL